MLRVAACRLQVVSRWLSVVSCQASPARGSPRSMLHVHPPSPLPSPPGEGEASGHPWTTYRCETPLSAELAPRTRRKRRGWNAVPSARGRYLFTAAQIFNLPYRRFVIGRGSVTPKTLEVADDPQVTNLRYSRLQVCATSVGNTVNRYRGRGSERGRAFAPPSPWLK